MTGWTKPRESHELRLQVRSMWGVGAGPSGSPGLSSEGEEVSTALSELLDATRKPDWQVAAECGIHPTQLSLYKTGRRKPHGRHAEKLAEYFKVDIPYVTGEWPELPSDVPVRVTEVSGPRPLLPAGTDDPTEWIE